MKDRPNGDAVTPSSPSRISSWGARVRGVMGHFWKIFAVTSLVAGLSVGYRAVGWHTHDDQDVDELSVTEPRNQEDGTSRGHAYRFRLIRDLIDKQSQPASIVFKNQAPAAVGYLASVDDECVVLRSLYKEEAKEQTILIPWENILYIRLNTKLASREQETTALRDPGSRPSARVRR